MSKIRSEIHGSAVGKVYIVGAGPGDPDLITQKGLKVLKQAQVILYDNLINKKLLNYADNNAEIIYVGKKSDSHAYSQENINNLLTEKANAGKIVVRLKGGDPFVFGRGGEEALVLAERKIPYEIVPGVTSAIAGCTYAGIPITHRLFSSEVTFITGHEAVDKSSSKLSWKDIATYRGTIVFLMGVRNLPEIINNLIKYGKDVSTPIACIQSATLPEQQVITGNLGNILDRANRRGLHPPALIVLGDTVLLRDNLMWFEKRPLFGKRIVVTRSREQASKLVDILESYGANVTEMPVVKIVFDENSKLYEIADKIGSYDWLIFTSVNGVKAFFNHFLLKESDLRKLGGIRIAAIGRETAKEVEKYYISVDFSPSEYVAETFVAEFLEKYSMKSKKVVIIQSNIGRDYIPEALISEGASVTRVCGYLTLLENSNYEGQLKLLYEGGIDWVTFTSSSTVRGFFNIYKGEKLFKIASIGPITSSELRANGFEPDVEASEHTINGVVNSIINFYE